MATTARCRFPPGCRSLCSAGCGSIRRPPANRSASSSNEPSSSSSDAKPARTDSSGIGRPVRRFSRDDRHDRTGRAIGHFDPDERLPPLPPTRPQQCCRPPIDGRPTGRHVDLDQVGPHAPRPDRWIGRQERERTERRGRDDRPIPGRGGVGGVDRAWPERFDAHASMGAEHRQRGFVALDGGHRRRQVRVSGVLGRRCGGKVRADARTLGRSGERNGQLLFKQHGGSAAWVCPNCDDVVGGTNQMAVRLRLRIWRDHYGRSASRANQVRCQRCVFAVR